MNELNIKRVLLIDDLEMNNEISGFTIKKVHHDIEIVAFTKPVEGLRYIKDTYEHDQVPTVLLLDINMPELNGWDVLDILDSCDDALTKDISIYILSSSIDPRDKHKAANAAKVVGFLERPLTMEMVQHVLTQTKGQQPTG